MRAAFIFARLPSKTGKGGDRCRKISAFLAHHKHRLASDGASACNQLEAAYAPAVKAIEPPLRRAKRHFARCDRLSPSTRTPMGLSLDRMGTAIWTAYVWVDSSNSGFPCHAFPVEKGVSNLGLPLWM